MQIAFHSSLRATGGQALSGHVQGLVGQALARFGHQVTSVDAHLSDADGDTRTGTDGIHCTLLAHLAGTEPVTVRSKAGHANVAIADAVHKLKRAVGTALARHDPRSQRAIPPPMADAVPTAGAARQQELP